MTNLGMDEGFTLWFTGLSGAGKSTLARIAVDRLRECGRRVELLDGDLVRSQLSPGLGFSRKDRDENVRRIGFLCELLNRNGVIAVVAAISPYRAARDEVRERVPRFAEIHVDCPVAVLVERDVKGLYKKALAGKLQHFTGVDDPYESPLRPELRVASASETVGDSADRVWEMLRSAGWV